MALTAAVAVFCGWALFWSEVAPAAPSVEDVRFASWLGSIADAERELGALARSRGSTARVRRFGRLLEADAHLEQAAVLHVLSSRAASPAPPDPAGTPLVAGVKDAPRSDFDRMFLAGARGLEQDAVATLAQVRWSAPDGAARDASSSLLALFEQHLRIAASLERREQRAED